MQENLFVPREQSLKLKELGFSQEVFGWYYTAKEHLIYDIHKGDEILIYEGSPNKFTTYAPTLHDSYVINIIPSPLWQQVFDWFEEEHKLYCTIDNVILSYGIIDCRDSIEITKTLSNDDQFKTKLELKLDLLDNLIKLSQEEPKGALRATTGEMFNIK